MSKKTNTNTQAVESTETALVTVKTNEIVLTADQQTMFDGMTTKSARIRFLSSLGHKNGPIAKFLSPIYYPDGSKKVLFQHVRNVLNQPIKSTPAA